LNSLAPCSLPCLHRRQVALLRTAHVHADAHHALLPRAPMARLAGLATELRTVRAELHAAAAEPPKGAPAAPGAAPASSAGAGAPNPSPSPAHRAPRLRHASQSASATVGQRHGAERQPWVCRAAPPCHKPS